MPKFKYTETDHGFLVEFEKEQIGSIRQSESSKKWMIDKLGPQYDYNTNSDYLQGCPFFATKDDAAWGLLNLWKTIEANPLGEDMRLYIEAECRRLSDDRKHLRNQFLDIDRKTRELANLATKYGIEFSHTSDLNKEVNDLVKFLDEHYNDIYEKFGKDWARTLRAYIASVVRHVDPAAAEKI